ncbi:anti-sigma factor [Ramlibacter sp. USB13]|uniref:Anti-sigma factor n=1 Tax=Ramlibacter cellulosilyticus TaxID=2764187 RepID=A0A923SD85_9BURK|nr:anti-sigma factor [Ramlibacter cellulosilyticus]MBC5785068.1 anti-sigma factor [Ramlibacter cellulosilyticus]
MDPMRSPERADRLAAAYALGSLRGGARRRFEAAARQSPALRAHAILWQERLAAMTELQPEEQPSPNVWRRIAIALRSETQPAPPTPARRVGFWRGAALSGAFAALVAFMLAGYLGSQLTQLSAAPEIRYVSMLEDDRSAPAMLVTFDARHGTLTLKRLGTFQEGPDRSLQLWALPPSGGPQSLGVLAAGGSVTLPAGEGQVRQVPALAISLEPRGGAPAGSGPTGPVLFKGALLPTT